VQGSLGEFEARGARVVAVGQGTGSEAAEIARTLHVAYPCFGDPEHRAYDVLELGRTGLFGLTLQPFLEDPAGAMRNLAQADLKASVNPRSDVRRLAGVMIVDREGTVRYLHRSKNTTDVPATEELLGVVAAL